MQLSNPEILFWMAATRIEGAGPIRLRKWNEHFGSMKAIFSASMVELRLAGASENQVQAIRNFNWKLVEEDLLWCEKNHCHLLTWSDDEYPHLLREISDPPALLYVQGNVELVNQPQIAIVGSRNPTRMGAETAEQFACMLAQSGLVITSGLALGIDAASHRGALSSTGKTLAVMGTGLKQIYPHSHLALAKDILVTGAIISEFPPSAPPKASYFPLRNRVISGLSLGVLVVEAALQSGSLISARFATEQGREVFAIPGSIHNPLAKGCHYLLKQGAKLVETMEDILVELAPLRDSLPRAIGKKAVLSTDSVGDIGDQERQLMAQIGYEATSLDTIVVRSGLTPGEVSSMLLSLELMGYVSTGPGGYLRNRGYV